MLRFVIYAMISIRQSRATLMLMMPLELITPMMFAAAAATLLLLRHAVDIATAY